jgi:hypothetical protein
METQLKERETVMGEPRTIVGRLDERGILPILELALAERWTGELRLKQAKLSASLWIVTGEIVHALVRGTTVLDGVGAFGAISVWQDGAYTLVSGALPPERSVRIPAEHLLMSLRQQAVNHREPFGESQRSAVVGRALLHVFDGLRERVPGLESLSLMRGPIFEATTSQNAAEMDWMDRQLQSFFAKDHQEPDTLYVQEGGHALLVLKHGPLATVLSARIGTAPEALFWAGAEAQRRVLKTAETLLPSR